MSQRAKKAHPLKKRKANVKDANAKARAKANERNNIPIYNPDPSPQITHFLRPSKRFNILPEKSMHYLISIYADMLPESFEERYNYIEKHFPISSPIAGTLYFPSDPINIGWSKEKSLAIRRAVVYISRHRFAFKKLLHHMRFKRLHRANEEDLLTGEIPKHPVQIVSWTDKIVYTFEAYTLMKDITERILHHQGFFEDPQDPRNPFTNIPLTQSQMIAVWNSISHAGIPVSSAFTLFRNARFIMKRFVKENVTFLKLNSLRKTFKDAKSYDYRERMLDFIVYCYNIETIDCSLQSFKNALLNYPNHHLIKRWARLCESYYETEILYNGNAQMIHDNKDMVLDDTYDILHLQRELISLNTIVETIQSDSLLRIMETLDFL